MKTGIYEPAENMVQSMRKIRDEISNEIKDMTFEEERAFLDKLLKTNQSNIGNNQNEASKKLK